MKTAHRAFQARLADAPVRPRYARTETHVGFLSATQQGVASGFAPGMALLVGRVSQRARLGTLNSSAPCWRRTRTTTSVGVSCTSTAGESTVLGALPRKPLPERVFSSRTGAAPFLPCVAMAPP